MSHKHLVLAFFADAPAAEAAAASIEASGVAEGDAVGVLMLDADGKLDTDKVGATSVAAGAGVGAALVVLGPAALGIGLAGAIVGGGIGAAGGALAGSMHHKGLKLSHEDKERISSELSSGKAAVGVMAHEDQVAAVQVALTDLGGAATSHEVVDEAALSAGAAEASAPEA